MKKRNHNCFCAFCKSPRSVPRKKHVSLIHFLAVGSLTLFLMFSFPQLIDGRFIVLFALTMGLIEVGVQIRWRLSVACTRCGFDPVLYLKNHKAAADKVKRHLEAIDSSPLGRLSDLNLPKRKAPEKEKALAPSKVRGEVGTNVSKHV